MSDVRIRFISSAGAETIDRAAELELRRLRAEIEARNRQETAIAESGRPL